MEANLTPRELQVLRLIVVLGDSKTVAHELGVSASVVRQHLAHVHQKCRVGTTIEAIWMLRRLIEGEQEGA